MNDEPKKILAVDDSRLSRRFVTTPLREAGFEVIEAENGELGLAAAAEHNPDLIVSDLLMPVMNGFEMIIKLREVGSIAPIIVVSADIQEASRRECHSLGTAAFLNKPFEAADLLAAVNNALRPIEVA